MSLPTSVPQSGCASLSKGATHVTCAGDGVDEGTQLKLHATYVSVDDFDDQYFEISFDTEDPGADFDLSAPLKPYLLIQRQFEDDMVASARRTPPLPRPCAPPVRCCTALLCLRTEPVGPASLAVHAAAGLGASGQR
jgi:hypothetical protein